MSQESYENNERDAPDERVEARRDRQLNAKKKASASRTILLLFIVIGIGATMYAVTGKDEEEELEEVSLQSEVAVIDDTVDEVQGRDDTPEEMTIPALNRKEKKEDSEEQDRITELEEQIARLAKQSQGQNRYENLDDELRRMQEEENAGAADQDPALTELEMTQIRSTALIFDDSTESDASKIGPGQNSGSGVIETDKSDDQIFLQNSANSGADVAVASELGDLSRVVVQGTIISAVLETAINTELPGALRAQVSEDVYSYDGSKVLLPAGTRLIGGFSTDIKTAQKRVLIAWNRAITPKGKSIALGAIGVDRLGQSGSEGDVDLRLKERYGGALLISMISALPDIAVGVLSKGTVTRRSNSGQDVTANQQSQSAATDAISSATSSLGQESQSAIGERFALDPIITIPQGEEIRIFVNRDLVF